jgi:hypothetical protein
MEYHKETSCVAILISNKLKSHVFLFTMSLFSSMKSENRRAEQVLLIGKEMKIQGFFVGIGFFGTTV